MEHADFLSGTTAEAGLATGVSMIRKGFHKDSVVSEIRKFLPPATDFEEVYSICRARIKGKEKFSLAEQMYMTLEDLQFATPELVAAYRAERMNSRTPADLACGIGGQALFLAKRSDSVVAVERDRRKLAYAKKNAAAYGITNITFIEGDCLEPDIARKVAKKCDTFLCDPQRPLADKLDNMQPAVSDILSRYGNQLAYEYPPQTPPDVAQFDCEKEYLSVDGKLNRLTLYFGTLKRHDVSAVSLPNKEVLHSGMKSAGMQPASEALAYLYEADTAVTKAGLLPQLAARVPGALVLQGAPAKTTLLTFDKRFTNPFLRRFKVVATARNETSAIRRALKEAGIGTVVLRGSVDQHTYWEMRKQFESSQLPGKAHLFLFKNTALVCADDS